MLSLLSRCPVLVIIGIDAMIVYVDQPTVPHRTSAAMSLMWLNVRSNNRHSLAHALGTTRTHNTLLLVPDSRVN